MAEVDVLIPTCNRPSSLVMTLAGVAAQSFDSVRVVVSDQSDVDACTEPVVHAMIRVLEAKGIPVEWHHRLPSQGIAEQREFLLSRSHALRVLYLDDDVFMEPWVLARLVTTLDKYGCGFVGAFPTGLSFKNDLRPDQQHIEFWMDNVRAEHVNPGSKEWDRAQLHRAANLWHVAQELPPGEVYLYKVAWVASCVLYERSRLMAVGGFSFWPRLPRYHSGEEVLVQNLLMRRWGGCGIIPSGAYHSELPSTVLNSEGAVDGHALDLLPELALELQAAS